MTLIDLANPSRFLTLTARLLPWLANEGAARTGGLKSGQWVTTGSWTGLSLGTAGSSVDVKFSTAGEVDLRFE